MNAQKKDIIAQAEEKLLKPAAKKMAIQAISLKLV